MTPLTYELTEQEAETAAARAAWRFALADGLLSRHLAPLTAFALAVAFAGVLGWTGLIARRAAEIALIAAAATYMIYRLWTRRRFLAARRAALVWANDLRRPTTLTAEDGGLRLGPAAWRFADGLDVEAVSGLVYVWPRRGPPLVWPERVDVTGAMLAFARAGTGRVAPLPVVDDDD